MNPVLIFHTSKAELGLKRMKKSIAGGISHKVIHNKACPPAPMNASVYSTSGRVALDEKELSLLDTSRIASTGSHTDL